MLKNLHIKDYDFKLIFLLICINTIGVFAVKSANPANYSKQLFGFIFGLCIMTVISFFDYKVLLKFYWLCYFATVGLLIAVKIAGSSANNAVRWFTIFGIRFQPSELAKILLIIFFAQFIMKYKDRINTVRFIFSFLLLALIPMYLIFDQPDLSTTIVVFIILASIIFVAGLSWKIILGIFVVAVPSAIIFLSVILKEGQTLINDYQRRRVLSFFYPEKFVDDAYQQTNSVIAIGSGGLVGKGFNNDMIVQAAEIALEHSLGLTCDPILGYVQIPCFIRNVSSVSIAITCANYGILGLDAGVSLDEISKAVIRVGEGLRSIRLNDQGICACNVSGNII